MSKKLHRFPENESRRPDLRFVGPREALPSFFQEEYPKFVEFIEAYYDYVRSSDGFDDLVAKLADARDIEVADPALMEALRFEFGGAFPDLNTIDVSTLIRLYQFWYRSKGTQNAVEQYFKLFLNTDAEVVLPGDNMLRCSDGEWAEEEQRWLTSRGHLSETSMVIQDSYFYQIFSYLIRSERSIIDWGPAFEKLAHPAGWIFFGEVRLFELAKFEYQTFSPTQVPGRQTRDSSLLLFGMAAMAMGASAQNVVKAWRRLPLKMFRHTYQEVAINFFESTYTIASFIDVPIEDLSNMALQTERRRPARITITTA